MVDGFYWIESPYGPIVAERNAPFWFLPGSEDPLIGDDKVTVVAGPLIPPKVTK